MIQCHFQKETWYEEEEFLNKEQDNVVQTRAQLNKFQGRNPMFPPQVEKKKDLKVALLFHKMFLPNKITEMWGKILRKMMKE
jgi:hypothetical protein